MHPEARSICGERATFSAQDCIAVEMIASSKEDKPYATAIARFKSQQGAAQAVLALNGKQAGDDGTEMVVELISITPGGSVSSRWMPDASPTNGFPAPQGSRFSETFRDMDRISPSQSVNSVRNHMDGAIVDGVSPTFLAAHPGNGTAFNGQSPIGHPLERQHISGRSMIQEDGADDETNEIMQNPAGFMWPDRHTMPTHQGRRATAPNISSLSGRMGSLHINSNVGSSASPLNSSGVVSPRGYANGIQSVNGQFSPPGMAGVNGNGMYGNAFSNTTSPTSSQYQPYPPRNNYGQTLPPVNPADQNPPCNTLYVGNLPMDTSEDELKGLFSKARGYRRLCFRLKGNGPMCFVEFEDVSHATRALKDLYGTLLSNSIRGGIRLSFSKNPLGVRGPAQQSPISPNPGHGAGAGSLSFGGPIGAFPSMNNQGFSTASGPPPGLPAPQGFAADRRPRTESSGAIHSMMNGPNAIGVDGYGDASGRFSTFYGR